MNKTIFFLILAVCILGMALILLNQRLGRAPEPRPTARSEQSVVADTPMTEPAPEYPVPVPAPTVAAEDAPAARAALPEAVKRDAESEREAAAAAAAALAVEQKEADAALHATPPTPPAVAPAAPAPAASTPPRPAASAPRETAPRPQAAAPERATAKKPATPEKAPAAASGPRTITRFVVFARDTGATVRLTGNGPLRYKSMNLENPDRVVLDLEGDWEVKAPAVPKNPLVSAVRVGDMDGRTRIVIDLKGKPRTARVIPAKTGDGVDVRVDQ